MSRTNGPGALPPNQWPERPQGPAAPYPDQGYQQSNPGYPPQPPAYPPQHGYAPPAPQPGYHYPDLGHGGDSYSQPTLGGPAHPQHYQQPAAPTAYDPARQPPPMRADPGPSYAPQFEPYVPPTGRTQPPAHDRYALQPQQDWNAAPEADPRGYPPFEPVTQPPTQPAHRQREARIVPQEPAYPAPQQRAAPEWPPAPELRGATYDQHPQWNSDPAQQQAGYAGQPGYADPYAQQGYEGEAGYAPAAYPQQGYPQQGYAQPPPDYGAQARYAAEQQGQAYGGYGGQQGYDQTPAGYPAEPQFEAQQTHTQSGRGDGYAAPVPTETEVEYDADEVEYEDEERGGRGRMVMIAAALVGAIGIGGALAYGYKTMFGGEPSGTPPVVRSAGEPSKFKPNDPGGKKFAHSETKILGKLNDGSGTAATGAAPGGLSQSASSTQDDGSPRKVSTMIVSRDGSIVPAVASPPPGESPAAEAPVPQAPQRVAGVPGLTIVDGFGGRPPPSLTPSAPAISAPVAPRVVAPVAPSAPVAPMNAPPAAVSKPVTIAKPTVIAKAEPVKTASDAAEIETVKPAAKKVMAKKPPVNDAFGSSGASVASTTGAGAASAASAASAGGAGFVAVLASIPSSANSRIEALKQFADLQQRYPSQLQSKSPEVQAATLAGKGNFDRLIAGPPGSRQQASSLCDQLKAAGYADCWIKSY